MSIRERCYRIACRIFRREIIRDGFRGVLGRDPEEEALNAYAASFRGLGTEGLIRDLSTSKESWEKAQREHVQELMSDIYQGVTGKKPDEKMLSELEYQFKLPANNKLDRTIRNLIESNIGWEELFSTHSEKIVTEVYRGIFGRFPDQAGYNFYKSTIEENKSIIPMLNRLVKNEEISKKQEFFSGLDINQFIEGIGKALDEGEVLKTNSKEISDAVASSSTLAEAVKKIKQSERYLRAKKTATLIPEDLEERLREKIVFLHIDKTAGTTIHEEFKKRYGYDKVLLKHEDPLYRYSPEDLDLFQVIGGHFNYDSIRYSRLDQSKIITFFRNPIHRFESLYNFWRSHDKNHPNYVIFHELSDNLPLEDLCFHPDIQESRLAWNHMTWAVMGQTLWNQWRIKLRTIKAPEERSQYLATEVKPRMKKRLRSFYFIGEQETFDHSMNALLKQLGQPTNKSFDRHNDTMINLTIKEGFKKDFKKVILSETSKEKVSTSLLELDLILYSQFKNANS